MTDGVSIVADQWARTLSGLGFDIRTVAGEGPVDLLVPGLAIDASAAPSVDEVAAALAEADLVVVENLLSIPLNLEASSVVADVLRDRPAVLHHHDPPWQRERFAHITELPVDRPAWRHVTINQLTRDQMADRGIEAVTIYNGFETDVAEGDRVATRHSLGVDDTELLVGHPVRAIPRKNIPAAVALCEQLGATYWLLGGAEEAYDAELTRILAGATCRVVHRPMPHGPDLYAAPDLIAFPSTWEGFGNPPVEAAIHRRPTAVGPYPVAAELRSLGFEWFDADDVAPIEAFLATPDEDLLDRNRRTAVKHFSTAVVAEQVTGLLDDAGWLP